MAESQMKVDGKIINANTAVGGTARYLYKMGIAVADDIMQRVAHDGRSGCLHGAYVIRLEKPIPCVFITFGLNGVAIPDTGLCSVGDACNPVTKAERLATADAMRSMDPDGTLGLRMQWFLLDMKETCAKVLRVPSNEDIAHLSKTYVTLKERGSDAAYKTIARIARRRTTAGADIPDGHEDDSDKDPLQTYLDEMSAREEKLMEARKKRLRGFPDTPQGRKIAKLFGAPPHRTPTENAGRRARKKGAGAAPVGNFPKASARMPRARTQTLPPSVPRQSVPSGPATHPKSYSPIPCEDCGCGEIQSFDDGEPLFGGDDDDRRSEV